MVMREHSKSKKMRMRLAILFAMAILASPWWVATDCMAGLGDPLQNGDFSSDLSGWTTEGPVTWLAGAAVLGEDDWGGSSLMQEFTLGIPIASASLSFDYLAGFEPDGQESFTASLLNPSSFSPLVGSMSYYFMHDWDDDYGVDEILYDPAYVSVTDIGGGWRKVSLDLGSLGGAEVDAFLAFDFVPGLFDGNCFDGQITIDNVAVIPVPVPSAVVLAIAGFGTALCRLRRRS